MKRQSEKTIAQKKSHMKPTRSDVIFNVVNTFLLCLVVFIVGYPIIYILSSSFSSTAAVTSGKVWFLPVEPSLYSYEVILQYKKIFTGYRNSITYTVLGTLIGVIVTVCAAYPLSRPELKGKPFFNWIFLFTMLFSGGLIPTYILMRNLSLLDTLWVMILPSAVSAWNIIITRTYFKNAIPNELIEAATIDGCSDFKALLHIVLPLSGAILAVITLFFAVWLWNSYFSALIYLQTDSKYPLQIVLRDILIMNSVDPSMIANVDAMIRKQGLSQVLRYSLIVVASAPLLIVYPFVQKYFIKGVMIGSIKG
jgi:multiple sugar transport system permease protein/putative aldouronate transport system permease protein